MIALTLNSKKGKDLTTYPDSAVYTNITTGGGITIAAGATSFTTANNLSLLLKLGDTFTYPAVGRSVICSFNGTISNTTLTLTSNATTSNPFELKYLY